MTLPVAVILAAGQGVRLAPLTHDRPKALVDVAGRTLLDRSTDALSRAGFSRVVVVTGYRADLVDEVVAGIDLDMDVEVRFNPDFAIANNIVSFLTVADVIAGGFCLLNSDTLFDPAILVDLARAPGGCWLVVDEDEPLGAEEMKVRVDEGGIIRRVNKGLPPAESAGEYIGLARFDAPGAEIVIDAARGLVESGARHLYYEDAFDRAADRLSMRPLPTVGRAWTEVDDMVDYARALEVAHRLAGGAAR